MISERNHEWKREKERERKEENETGRDNVSINSQLLRASLLQERTPHSSPRDYNRTMLCATISRIVGGQCRISRTA